MALVCRPLEAAHVAAWDRFVDAMPNGTFFHRAAWADVLSRAFRHAPHYVFAERDGAITGVLPLMHVKTALFGNTLISSPFCVYGGPLASDRESFALLDRHAAEVMARSGATATEYRFREAPPDGWLEGEWQARDDLYVTFRRPITADDEANMKAIPRKQRAMVRKAIERGLTSTADQNVDRLHAIYAESVHNLGTPVFSRSYFRLLAEVFGRVMDVVTVSDAGRPVAAVLNFYDRGEVIPYYGGGTGAARGCTLFDFGRSKVGTGAFSFKKNWGFTPQPLLHRFRLRQGAAMPDHNPLNPKYRLFIAGWKRLPLPIANRLGPFIVRGVG
jgi:FemAB-related protein (PEP-CTERM system-associated)